MLVINKKLICRYFLLILLACTLFFIWSNSLEDATESSNKSGKVIEIVKPIIDPEDNIDDDLFVKIVRKLAHFSEFALLGAEMYLFIMTFGERKQSVLPYCTGAVGICFVCAVADEMLQLTSEGRSCEWTDMLIDLGGIVCGVVVVAVIRGIILRIGSKKRINEIAGK